MQEEDGDEEQELDEEGSRRGNRESRRDPAALSEHQPQT